MNIIVVGCGKVGYTIAERLSKEKNVDLTVIDNDQDVFEKASEMLDAMFVTGSGLSANLLLEAGARDADLLISVTNADEANILCCITAKRLGTKHTIARVREWDNAMNSNKTWRDLGLDMIINPEQEAAREISRLLRFPTADDIETFVGGRVELASFKVSEAQLFFVGKSVLEIFSKKKTDVLLAVVERDNMAIIPHGDLIFEKNDIISILGRPSNIMDFFSLVGKSTEKIKTAMIIGGGKITYYLLDLLNRHSSSTHIKVVEIDRRKCELLSEAQPRCLVVCGDGIDEDLLLSEDIKDTEAVICLTDRDEENIIIALYSIQLKIKKVISKINHINQNMIKNIELGSIVCPKNSTSNQIIRYVRGLSLASGTNIRTLYKIIDNEDNVVEAVEFSVGAYAKCLNTPLKDLRLKPGVLIGCIVRSSNIIIPTGETSIMENDFVIVIVKNDNILELDDILPR